MISTTQTLFGSVAEKFLISRFSATELTLIRVYGAMESLLPDRMDAGFPHQDADDIPEQGIFASISA